MHDKCTYKILLVLPLYVLAHLIKYLTEIVALLQDLCCLQGFSPFYCKNLQDMCEIHRTKYSKVNSCKGSVGLL